MTLVSERGIGPSWVRPALAIGFLGRYTTFSTFSYETLRLAEAGSRPAAAANVAGNASAALLGVYLGTVPARAL